MPTANRQLPTAIFILLFSFLSGQSFESLPIQSEKTNGGELVSAFAGGMNAPQFSEVDLDNDGEKDLYVFDRVGDVHLTFLKENTGDEIKYRFEPRFAKNFPDCYEWVLLRDYDGDEIPDIFTYSGTEGIKAIRVFKGKYVNGKIAFGRVNVSAGFDYNVLTYGTDDPTEIFVSKIDYPSIEDIDGDGDLDILTYEPTGIYVQLFENRAVENGWSLDSLVFELKDDCWGRFSEFTAGEAITLGANIDDCPEWTTTNIHPGSTLLSFDENDDGLPEILIGDNSNSTLAKLTNGGSPETAWMIEKDTTFPSYDVSAHIDFFVSSFLLDVDNDEKKDLIVAPNWEETSENYHVGWFYKNTGSNKNFIFEYQQSDWLVSDMYDFGSYSAPTFADVNGDGLTDIVVGNETFYLPNFQKDSRLFLLLNVGTATEPIFRLEDENWLNFQQFSGSESDFTPAFGDLDGDGDEDLLVGNGFGSLFYVENLGSAGNPFVPNFISPQWKGIDIGQFSAPQIADLNRDSLPDLLIGDRFGNLNFFPNIGSLGNPEFHSNPDEAPNNSEFGNIDVSNPFTQIGHSVPYLTDLGDEFVLLVGTESGATYFYQFNSDEIEGEILPVSENWGETKRKVGVFSKPALADLNSDGVFDLILGNIRGGLTAFQSHLATDGTTRLSEISNEKSFEIYPNPATDFLNIGGTETFYNYLIYNKLGILILKSNQPKIDIRSLPGGVYFLKIENVVYRFVKI